MTELRDAALYYARWRGWAVFPLRAKSKEPLVSGAYKAATAELDQVEAWWTQYPDANIGLATGSVSGLWVLDIDGEQGEASFEALVHEHGDDLAETLMANTGKGHHLYWRLPAGREQGRRIGVRPGLDVIGGNGYLVAPPSIHPSGRQYTWLNEHVTPEVAPDWLFDLEKPKPVSARTNTVFAVAPRLGTPQTGPVQDPASYLRGVARAASRSVAGAVEGTRNHELFKQAAWICSVASALGLDDGAALRDVWQAARLVGLEEREIERTLQSAMEKGRSNPAQGLR
jgi:hypothetical protein